jgi:hypothetical protein
MQIWERVVELSVHTSGVAHMIAISRDFEFVGGHYYSDTTPRAQVEAERRQGGARAQGWGGAGSARSEEGRGKGEGEEEDDSDEAAPEVGQLMFVGPEQRVVRGEVVRVRVSHGADGFRAALLP